MASFAALLSLVGALFLSPLASSGPTPGPAAIFAAAPARGLEGWLGATARRLQESRSRADFLERLDDAVAGLDLAGLGVALRAELRTRRLDVAFSVSEELLLSEAMIARAERILGQRRAARFVDCWRRVWPSVWREVAGELDGHAPATLVDILEHAESELAHEVGALGDIRRDESARVADLVARRWMLANLALAASSDAPAPDFIAETYLDLFETVVALARYGPDASAPEAREALSRWQPPAPSLGWLLVHVTFEDARVGALLREQPGLLPLVVETRLRLASYFSQEATHALGTQTDPDSGAESLTLAVKLPGSLLKAAEQLDRFYAEWAREAHAEWWGRFLVDVESA